MRRGDELSKVGTTVPHILCKVWPSFRPNPGSESKIPARILKSFRGPFSEAEFESLHPGLRAPLRVLLVHVCQFGPIPAKYLRSSAGFLAATSKTGPPHQVHLADLSHILTTSDRRRNTPKSAQKRSESLCAGLWLGLALPSFMPQSRSKSKISGRFLTVFAVYCSSAE